MKENKVGNVVRFLAILLTVGGILGIGVAVYMGYRLLPQHWPELVLVALFAALFVQTALTGVRLWRNEPRGWRWAKILFAAQIPVLTVPGLRYKYYAGIALDLLGGKVNSHVALGLGASGDFYLGIQTPNLVYGVNVVALLAFTYLLVKSGPAPVAIPLVSDGTDE